MADIIESANSAYEDRDRAQENLEALKQQALREQQEFEKEWKELNALIEKDKKMKDFMKLKERERLETEPTEEEQIKKRAARGYNVSKEKAQYVSAERVHSYEEAFNKI